ncbi:MAG: gliding motility-associated C-terminal domain-containing protein, partial [Bacteroidales bacterium]|nr:gliding motility-associated C-terminal domain-containing protein [Bacteroidales bacterium]
LRADAPTQDDDNWHSAASTAGFGTPGYENSQKGIDLPRDDITVTPQVFSPDNDGFDDYTEFAFNFTQLENRLSIQIFDRQGLPVRMLVNNEYCGAEAVVRWDGTDNNGQLLPSGSYVVLVSWWNADGKTKRVRRVVGIWR